MSDKTVPHLALADSRFLAFFDERGDHSLVKIDPDFPLFLLALVVIERVAYRDMILPEVNRFKLRYWNHEGVDLHSRDIRVATEPFDFLLNPDVQSDFKDDLIQMMDRLPFTLFVAGIRKHRNWTRFFSTEDNPYGQALGLTMERVLHFLEKHGEVQLPMAAESRGKKEDDSLRQAFCRILADGALTSSAEAFRKLNCTLTFLPKHKDNAGIQIAGLCAFPCVRHILSPEKSNVPYEVVQEKIYNCDVPTGWTVFP
jgi:hypothetical protein